MKNICCCKYLFQELVSDSDDSKNVNNWEMKSVHIPKTTELEIETIPVAVSIFTNDKKSSEIWNREKQEKIHYSKLDIEENEKHYDDVFSDNLELGKNERYIY